jgi:hypothetical protein
VALGWRKYTSRYQVMLEVLPLTVPMKQVIHHVTQCFILPPPFRMLWNIHSNSTMTAVSDQNIMPLVQGISTPQTPTYNHQRGSYPKGSSARRCHSNRQGLAYIVGLTQTVIPESASLTQRSMLSSPFA